MIRPELCEGYVLARYDSFECRFKYIAANGFDDAETHSLVLAKFFTFAMLANRHARSHNLKDHKASPVVIVPQFNAENEEGSP